MQDSIKAGETKRIISRAKLSDGGVYRCVASNDKETANDQVEIVISKFNSYVNNIL